ncbi:MAG: Trk system potassium transporter TrkA [Pseudomonadota bacterium]
MKIIILGAGQVGSSLAENLAKENNDVTIIDTNLAKLHVLNTKFDLRTIAGFGSHPDILYQAGAPDADMLIAVTDNDETNIVACQIAYTLFQTPTKIARIRSTEYLVHSELFDSDHIPIDFCISPERLVTEYVQHLVEHPGALQVLDFAKGKIRMVAIKPYFGGKLVGKTLAELYAAFPGTPLRIVAIYRANQIVEIKDTTTIEIGDEVFFIAAKKHVQAIMSALRRLEPPSKRILIVGGGHIGFQLAKTLEVEYQVKIVEKDPERAKILSEKLLHTTVLLGDASDRDLLVSENVEYIDTFCAVTDEDEANIMSALLAKRLGARQVMAIITRTAYTDLIEGGPIDIAISPQQATIGTILTHLRKGDVVNVYSLRRGAAEAIEIVAHGDRKTSNVVGCKLNEIKLPKSALVCAVKRGEEIILSFDDLVIESGDHVILLVIDKKHIREVEKLFQVNVAYIQ